MNAFAFSSILVFISSLAMAILVFWKSQNKKLPVLWGIFCISTSFWGLGGYKFSTTLSQETAIFWWQIGYISAIFAPVMYYHFISEYIEAKNKHFLLLAYILACAFLILAFFAPKLFFGELRLVFDQFYFFDLTQNKQPFFLMFYIGFYWIIIPYSFFLLIKCFRGSTGVKRTQIKYFILSSLAGWIGAHGTKLPEFGVDIYPFSNFLIVFYPIAIGYAIIQHRFMDINVAIRKGLVYSIAITIISLAFLVSVLIFERFFQGLLGYQTTIGSILAAIIIAIIFTPLKNKIQYFMDKIFYKGSREEIVQQNVLLRQEVAQTEKHKAVATLASGIAHEIRNPLTALRIFHDHFPEKKDDPEFLKKFNKITSQELTRIEGLVQELLDFAKPSPLELADCAINDLIDDTLDLLTSNMKKGNILVVKKLMAESCQLRADKNQLKQALLNIFLNSIEAMPGGGTLTVSTHLRSSASPSVIICVEDTGQGIAKKDLPRIFDPFFSKKDKGTGLGLSITHGIITEHGGTIKVESTPGKGTKFTIELPVNTTNN